MTLTTVTCDICDAQKAPYEKWMLSLIDFGGVTFAACTDQLAALPEIKHICSLNCANRLISKVASQWGVS